MPIVDIEPIPLRAEVDTQKNFQVFPEPTFAAGLGHMGDSINATLEKRGIPGPFNPTVATSAYTPGKDDLDHGSEKPDWSSTFGAAFRQDNTVGAVFSHETIPQDVEDGFNAWESIKGSKYERRWKSFVDTRSTRASDAVKRQIDREEEDRRLLDAAPWGQSLTAQIAAGVIDLPTLIPGGRSIAAPGAALLSRPVPHLAHLRATPARCCGEKYPTRSRMC
jgi:hypothetical protein